ASRIETIRRPWPSQRSYRRRVAGGLEHDPRWPRHALPAVCQRSENVPPPTAVLEPARCCPNVRCRGSFGERPSPAMSAAQLELSLANEAAPRCSLAATTGSAVRESDIRPATEEDN